MQASQDLCLVMLRVKRSVCALDLAHTGGLFVQNQLALLQQMIVDVKQAGSKIQPGQFQNPSQDSQHLQLLNCYSALVTALGAKLGSLETSLTSLHTTIRSGKVESRSASGSGSSNSISSSTGRSKTAQQLTATSLWYLLYISSIALGSWPRNWLARSQAEYSSVRTAMTCLMHLLLRLTRNHTGIWTLITDMTSLYIRQEQVKQILCFPLTYISSMILWPVPTIDSELSVLPSEFSALFCCLALEQLDTIHADPSTAEVAQRSAAMALTSMLRPDTPNGQLILTVCRFLTFTLGSLLELDISLPFQFINPAVIQLYKRAVFIKCIRHEAGLYEFDSYATMALLIALLTPNSFNKQEGCCSMTSSSRECERSGAHLLPLYIPTTPVSDVWLLRVLLKDMSNTSVEAEDVRYCLAAAMINGWQRGIPGSTPFSPPSQKEQVLGVLLALYHCACDSVAWMQKHTQQQHINTTYWNGQASFHPPLPSSIRHLTTAATNNVEMHLTLAELKDAIGERFKACSPW